MSFRAVLSVVITIIIGWVGMLNVSFARKVGIIRGMAYVIDGDTIRIEGRSIRLNGIDAEELDEPHGNVARKILIGAIAGRTVTCRDLGDRSYKRIVAVCYNYRGQDIAALVIASGGALDCKRYSGGRYRHLEPNGSRKILIQKKFC